MAKGKTTSKASKLVQECLATLGVMQESFSGCSNLDEEWKVIKKAYFAKILVSHPDKGGDAAVFREVQTSFESIRQLYDSKKISSFATSGGDKAEHYEANYDSFTRDKAPSWEYYRSAAEAEVPIYRVELAKSDRSACSQKSKNPNIRKCTEDTKFIPKGDIRIGSIIEEVGGYGRWVHLHCWRVPQKVWMGVPDPDICQDTDQFDRALQGMSEVLFSGFGELSPQHRLTIVKYVMNKENWASYNPKKITENGETSSSKSKSKQVGGGGAPASSSSSSSASYAASSNSTSATGGATAAASMAMVQRVGPPGGGSFIVPRPGHNGALVGSLCGKTVVMTGVFPEVGGGCGLNLGKDRVKALCESFGAKVTGSVSGKTDILIVGKAPGASKVSQAREKNVQMMNLRDLQVVLMGGSSIEDVQPMAVITQFSSGYRGNGLGYKLQDVGPGPGAVAKQTKEKSKAKPPKKAPASNKRSHSAMEEEDDDGDDNVAGGDEQEKSPAQEDEVKKEEAPPQPSGDANATAPPAADDQPAKRAKASAPRATKPKAAAKEPKAPKAPKAPKQPKAPKEPKVPKEPKQPKEKKAPVAAKAKAPQTKAKAPQTKAKAPQTKAKAPKVAKVAAKTVTKPKKAASTSSSLSVKVQAKVKATATAGTKASRATGVVALSPPVKKTSQRGKRGRDNEEMPTMLLEM